MQIAIEVLAGNRGYGKVSELAQSYGVSRQTVYNIAAKGEQVLRAGMQPGPHGPQVGGNKVEVTGNRLARGSVVLSEVGVSQRDVRVCLAELLDSAPSLGWVNGVLAGAEGAAAKQNGTWQPQIEESLSGDEIYTNGFPNLVVVGNESLYIYALSRQPDCAGDTWGITLLDSPECVQFSSDAGKGLAAGVKAAQLEVHQLDWDHLLRPLWGQAARLEQQAYAALQLLEERAAKFEQAHTEKRLHHHLTKWKQLSQQASQKVDLFDAFYQIARAVDECFALIDTHTGQLPDVSTAIEHLQALGDQLQSWSGRIYHKLSRNLKNWAPALFSYQPLLAEALQPLQLLYGTEAIAALSRIWQLEADQKRRPFSWQQRQHAHRLWCHSLDQAYALLGEQLWPAYQQLCQLLDRSWRGSMLAECINSLLRPLLARRKQTDQGCLELFRFFHNVRPFLRGKRAGFSPAQLVGLNLGDDPLLLLGFAPKLSI